jgi:hypothetical protein
MDSENLRSLRQLFSRVAGSLFGALLLYVLSVGPATYLAERRVVAGDFSGVPAWYVDSFYVLRWKVYAPLRMVWESPHGGLLRRYIDWSKRMAH